jgi:threonine/homoserine/homoserine lactone efflux protein
MALTFGVFVIYGVAASKVNLYISNSPTVIKWIQRFFAVAFASFGLKLMLLI